MVKRRLTDVDDKLTEHKNHPLLGRRPNPRVGGQPGRSERNRERDSQTVVGGLGTETEKNETRKGLVVIWTESSWPNRILPISRSTSIVGRGSRKNPGLARQGPTIKIQFLRTQEKFASSVLGHSNSNFSVKSTPNRKFDYIIRKLIYWASFSEL